MAASCLKAPSWSPGWCWSLKPSPISRCWSLTASQTSRCWSWWFATWWRSFCSSSFSLLCISHFILFSVITLKLHRTEPHDSTGHVTIMCDYVLDNLNTFCSKIDSECEREPQAALLWRRNSNSNCRELKALCLTVFSWNTAPWLLLCLK